MARPYAAALAAADACTHDLHGSTIDRRFRAGGYPGERHGESLYCDGHDSPREMIVRSLLFFQSEKSTNGWHWRNLKNRRFRRVGIGVAVVEREARVVYDFYGS